MWSFLYPYPSCDFTFLWTLSNKHKPLTLTPWVGDNYIKHSHPCLDKASQVIQWERIHLPMQMWVPSLGQDDPLEKEMATHSSILAWEIPWTEEPGGWESMGSQKSQTQLSNWVHACTHTHTHTHTHSLTLHKTWGSPHPCLRTITLGKMIHF